MESKYGPSLSTFVDLGRICVLKGGKETSDLAEYFPLFKTLIGPKRKKMASDYTFLLPCSLPNRNEVRLPKQVRTSFFTNWCGANLEQDFFSLSTTGCGQRWSVKYLISTLYPQLVGQRNAKVILPPDELKLLGSGRAEVQTTPYFTS